MKESKATVKDPVCGMEIDPKKAAATRTHDGQTFYFCSQDCAKAFDMDPHRYGHQGHQESQGHQGHRGHGCC